MAGREIALERIRMEQQINFPQSSIRPPAWAESSLRMVLPSKDAETVTGDLLEAYRDTIHPQRGRLRANLWYWRQVADFVMRASGGWGVLLGLIWVVGPFRMTLHQGGWFYAGLEQKLIAAMLVLLAARNSWRSGYLRGGILIATAIGLAGSVIWIGGAMFQAARWDLTVTPVESFRQHFDWPVFFMAPVLSLVASGLLGIAGATFGRLMQACAGIGER